MNERIAKLYDQSIIIEDGGDYVCGELDPEKFAELIVKECLDIAKNWEDQLENATCFKESNAVGIVAYRISRQFGVEE